MFTASSLVGSIASGTAKRRAKEESVQAVRVVCGHDCPDMCSLRAYVKDGKVLRVEGDPDHLYTAGYACAKVNRDAELIHSPERIATPLRRIGPRGGRDFAA